MKTTIIISACLFSINIVHAQKQVYTLQQCIDSALRKNITIRQSKFNAEAAGVGLEQARANRLPAVYGELNQAVNLGRNIDPFTNDYVNQTIGYGSYGVYGEVNLYTGGNLKNNMRRAESEAIAANKDLLQSKEQIRLNVLLAYLQVLSTEEQLKMTNSQALLSNEQLKKLELKNQKGVVATSYVADLKGQLLNDNLAVTELKNSLEWYKMELAQQMNIPYNPNIILAPLNIEEMVKPFNGNSGQVYQAALQNFNSIQAAENRTTAAGYGLKAARGLRLPQLFAGATVQTVYTSSAETINGKVGFSDQFTNNRSGNFIAGIRIPIVTSTIRNTIKLADIQLRNAQLNEERTKMDVWQQVERAYVAMTNALTRYQLLTNQLEAYQLSFKAAQARFETGVDGSANYLIAKNNLDRANTNYVFSKYDYILKMKVLDFYQNRYRGVY